MNIVIMAGGGGSRLWPLSRQSQPKQFLDLGSGKTLLEMTYTRARALVEKENVFVATIAEYGSKIKEMLPDVPGENIFYEPQRRDNAPAFAAVAAQLVRRGLGEDVAVFMWADHVFTEEQAYIEDVKKIPLILKDHRQTIAIVGHVPTSPETGLGYIEAGEQVEGYTDAYHVLSFKEKPDRETARGYVEAGNFFWNMGSISVRPSYLLEELRQYEPELMQDIDAFDEALERGDGHAAAQAYGQAKKISIDYAVLERTPRIIAVTGDYGWSDVGNWAAVKEVFGTKGDHVPAGHHIHVDSDNNYIYNATDKAVSIIGLRNSIVVVTGDAVLVTDVASSHKVKEVVQQLEEADKKEYL